MLCHKSVFVLSKPPFSSGNQNPIGDCSFKPILQSQSIFNLLYTSKLFSYDIDFMMHWNVYSTCACTKFPTSPLETPSFWMPVLFTDSLFHVWRKPKKSLAFSWILPQLNEYILSVHFFHSLPYQFPFLPILCLNHMGGLETFPGIDCNMRKKELLHSQFFILYLN